MESNIERDVKNFKGWGKIHLYYMIKCPAVDHLGQ